MKTTNELLLVQSDMFTCVDGTLRVSSARGFDVLPDVRLGASFKTVGEYQARFASPPDIVDLYHLTCVGDVWFGAGVVLKGTVIIVARCGERVCIADASTLENCVVTCGADGVPVVTPRV